MNRPYSFPTKLSCAALLLSAAALATNTLACGGSSSTGPTTTSTTTTTVPANTSTLTVTPTSLTFAPNVAAGATQAVTLSNTGTTLPVVMTSIVASGNFSVTSDCGASIAVGASCTATVAFTPVAPGSTGALTITDDAGTSPQTVGLTGPVVLAPSAILTPTTLAFSTQALGSTSPPQTVTITNPVNGISVALSIGRSSITGDDFAISKDGCQQPVAPGGSCTIGVTFTPTVPGVREALLSVFDNAATPSQTVTLRGSGQ